MSDSNIESLYQYLLEQLNQFDLCYIHLMNPLFPLTAFPHWPKDVFATFGKYIRSPIIANGGYTAQTAEEELKSKRADLVSFGTLYIANPDLPERIKVGATLAVADKNTMYGGGEHGYTDYPNIPT
jgi:N-ethylmaleimide reductase